jgi:hypothetical protein
MKSILEQVEGINYLVRELEKIQSKMLAGQFIKAEREVSRLMGILMKDKQLLLKEEGDKK